MRFLIILALLVSIESFAADTTKLYNPAANAKREVAAAVARAKKDGKHVLIQVGGNWCSWCYRYAAFVKADKTLNNLTNKNYVVYHLNYSPENKNLALLKTFGFPQRFGFPVFVVLDGNGVRLHTQDSALLEKGKSYDAEKVKSFLQAWTPQALNEKNYKE